MDFGTLLSVAQKNENSKQPIACYQTKFAPPKKPSKQAKALSDNIKKFLERKGEEEKQKALEEKRKRENLLALRDHKAQSRINKHLKVCKAANKSVLADAIDNENTAVTMAGPSQPDEDDYGYVSQEASAFYNQLMTKYNSTPSQKLFSSDNRKRTIKDIASTKDRVKQALKQQEVEEALGHRRKRKSSTKEPEIEPDTKIEKDDGDDKKEKDEKPKPKKRPMPPPIDFSELLKIAEKKQHEPIVIEVKPKSEESERLLTKKQMIEYAKEKGWRERKEQRNKVNNTNKDGISTVSSKSSKTQESQVNDTNRTSKVSEKPSTTSSIPGKNSLKPTTGTQPPIKKVVEKPVQRPIEKSVQKPIEKPVQNKPNVNKSSVVSKSEKDILLEERRKLEMERKKLEEMRQAIEEQKKKLKLSKSKIEDIKNMKSEKPVSKAKVPEKQDSLKNIPKQTSTASITKCRTPQMMNDKIKQFPPADLRPIKSKHLPPSREHRRPIAAHKRRIHDDEDEEEFDSELEDFIDDEVEDGTEDYSKYISEIFGYDKNKYKCADVDDDAAMESSFAQQLKEEYVSTKIGIMEDLEDMRMEALEKKRKALLKKNIKK